MVTEEDLFVTSMGGLWDDWLNLRPGQVDNTFSPPILGSHSSTALGLAIALPHRRIVALDTDGSILMNTGIMCTIGNERPENLTVIIFDNEIYESIGSPPTHTSKNTDLAKMAEGAGCLNCVTVDDVDAFTKEADRLLNDNEMGFMVAKIGGGVHEWPAEKRRQTDGVEDKYRFIRYVEKLEGIVIHGGAPQA
jgi:thiamine pyrophosphate-dependent acetolactate synthase large subunit-like protein